jgi:hypothetical protein
MYMTSEEREEAREHADDDSRYGFCSYCNCEQPVIEQDQGFDHAFGFYSLPTEVCVTCGERI